jgi:hypothetical protein
MKHYFLLIVLFAFQNSLAKQTNPSDTITGQFDLAGGYNPAALATTADIFFRHVYHQDNSPLWNGLYLQGGSQIRLSPAFGRIGVYAEWMPVAVFQLRMQVDRFRFFGNYGSLLDFADKNAPFGDTEKDARDGEELTGVGNRVLLQPVLRAKFGRYIVRNKTDYAFYELPEPGPYYLEQEYDTLLKTSDRLIANELTVLYTYPLPETFLFGPYYEYVHSFGAKLTRQRIGATFYYEPVKKYKMFDAPRFYIQTGFNLQDRNRDNEFYFNAGFGADINLK